MLKNRLIYCSFLVDFNFYYHAFHPFVNNIHGETTKLTFTCSKLTIETLDKDVKYIQS